MSRRKEANVVHSKLGRWNRERRQTMHTLSVMKEIEAIKSMTEYVEIELENLSDDTMKLLEAHASIYGCTVDELASAYLSMYIK